jgi:hypothetical protein
MAELTREFESINEKLELMRNLGRVPSKPGGLYSRTRSPGQGVPAIR